MAWTRDQLTVLIAIFVSQPFKVGDDQQEVNLRLARAFNRTPSAIDYQWRNVKYHLFRLDLYGVSDRHVGTNVKDAVDRYRVDLGSLRSEALEAIEANGWDLEELV